jgi:hypothetical protein
LFAAHQLVGLSADWWDMYVEAHEEPETINCQEFRNSFRTHHVPLGVMKLKKKEFEDLNQGIQNAWSFFFESWYRQVNVPSGK